MLNETCCVVVGGETVDDEAVGEVALARDGDALAGNSGGLGKELVSGGVGGRYAGDEQGEVEEVAPVEGKVLDLGLRDGACDLAAVGLEERSFGVDVNDRLSGADFERDWEIKGRADGEGDVASGMVKPG